MFSDEIRQQQVAPSDILVSYDVKALFTNVPVDETIQYLVDKAFANNWFNEVYGLDLTKNNLIEMLEIATRHQLFQFDGQLYQQIDGVAMGSPLGPLMANALMCSVEERLKTQGKIPDYYKRYVDDTLSRTTSISEAESFHQILNDAHPSLSFTMEVQTNGQLPFLGMLLTKDETSISTSVYHKLTDSGLLLHYHSHTDKRYKTGLIKTMLYRAKRLSSSPQSFSLECNRFFSTFVQLKYPEAVVKSIITNFLKEIARYGVSDAPIQDNNPLRRGANDSINII